MLKVKVIEFEGDWYVIPEEKSQSFDSLVDIFYSLKIDSDEWYNTCDTIECLFGDYKTGGDINNIQLWADI